jgi:hypothetical protein
VGADEEKRMNDDVPFQKDTMRVGKSVPSVLLWYKIITMIHKYNTTYCPYIYDIHLFIYILPIIDIIIDMSNISIYSCVHIHETFIIL